MFGESYTFHALRKVAQKIQELNLEIEYKKIMDKTNNESGWKIGILSSNQIDSTEDIKDNNTSEKLNIKVKLKKQKRSNGH
jgi:hypothetical protein